VDRGRLALALAAVLTACGQTPPGQPGGEDRAQWSAPGKGVVVSREGETVRYSGEITKTGFAAVKALTDKRPVRALEIDSMGGEVMTAMDFGDWVHDRHVEVIVDTLCLSSCANYVFPAAPIKTIRPGGLVAWHGSARQRGLMRLMESAVDAKVNTLDLPPAQREERRARMWRNTQAYMRTAQARQDASAWTSTSPGSATTGTASRGCSSYPCPAWRASASPVSPRRKIMRTWT
jgi:hypothetical protein